MEKTIQQLTDNFAQLEKLLISYTELGSDILKIESEEAEKITDKINQRDELIGEMDIIKKECTALIDSFDSDNSAQIRSMLSGTNINQHISNELAPVRNAVVSLRSAQMQAMEIDKSLQAQFTSRINEAKEELVQLKNDKKKLDYYSSINPSEKLGGSLDSSF